VTGTLLRALPAQDSLENLLESLCKFLKKLVVFAVSLTEEYDKFNKCP